MFEMIYKLNPSVKHLVSLAVLSIAAATFLFTVAPGAHAVQSVKIAFVSDRDGNREIYTMDPDGANQTRLTENAAVDREPSWSPGADKIAFSSYRDGNYELYVMDRFGGDVRRVTHSSSVNEAQPDWSPIGARMVFAAYGGGDQQLHTVDVADGGNDRRITNSPYFAAHPSWSPSGRWVAYDSTWVQGPGYATVFAIDPENIEDWRVITRFYNSNRDPDWSPDSSRVAFVTDRSSASDIWKVDSSGYNLERLTYISEWDMADPVWSPDGSKIAFAARLGDDWEIYVVGSSGGVPQNISQSPGSEDIMPSWGNTRRINCERQRLVGTYLPRECRQRLDIGHVQVLELPGG